jgi:hypothetical protein
VNNCASIQIAIGEVSISSSTLEYIIQYFCNIATINDIAAVTRANDYRYIGNRANATDKEVINRCTHKSSLKSAILGRCSASSLRK